MKRRWTAPKGAMKTLRDAMHEHAMKYEPTSQFPGVDIDAIHHKRELDEVVREIQSLEAA